MFRWTWCALGLLLLVGCQNDGGKPVAVNTLIHKDTLSAKDSNKQIGLSLDSLIIDTTAAADGVVNNDTVALPPSASVLTGKTKPAEIVAFAQQLKGVPYVYGSSNPKVGFDCSGFITYVFNHFGVAVPRSSIDFTNVGKAVSPEQAKPGDLILFTGTDPIDRFVGHMGIVVENSDSLRFIHSTSGKAMGVTTTPLNEYYKKRYVKTIRIFPQND